MAIAEKSIIGIKTVDLVKLVFDPRARNGKWCCTPYHNHPRGCPNFPRCPQKHPDLQDLVKYTKWIAIVEEFDMQEHIKYMKNIHQNWTERQCRNPLYWQGTIRKDLRLFATDFIKNAGGEWIFISCPEASGLEVFKTMELAGIYLERKPNIVRKIALIGKKS